LEDFYFVLHKGPQVLGLFSSQDKRIPNLDLKSVQELIPKPFSLGNSTVLVLVFNFEC